MPVKEEAIQLINEDKHFNQDTLKYFNECMENRNVGLDYHVISVFGSQSSGKSTLLNILFNTRFDTMDALVKRQQTTKGIWVAHTKNVLLTSPDTSIDIPELFVLDVEGSDGSERGEDQDFERKAALFAISVSEVLIVNMWEQQIGLYQGNNMALLKTVFEVNLSLFGKNTNEHKLLLLFVIRDHVGVTPLSSLGETITSELEKVWSDLSKPAGCETASLNDFFDLKFVGLAHKLLQEEKFVEDVKKLGDSFVLKDDEEYYFKPQYHQNLPLDGWTMYAENCWDQIENNRDLDLPTQQILVARFKTDEIASETLAKLNAKYDSIIKPTINDKQKLMEQLQLLKAECLDAYDEQASRYSKNIYLEKRQMLATKIEEKFMESISVFFDSLSEDLLKEIEDEINDKGNHESSFSKRLSKASSQYKTEFYTVADEFIKFELLHNDSHNELVAKFDDKLHKLCTALRSTALSVLINRSTKFIALKIKEDVTNLLSHPEMDIWDKVMEVFNNAFDTVLHKYKVDEETFDFQFDGTEEENKATYKNIRIAAWKSLSAVIHDYLKEDTIINLLRDRFENNFKYDKDDSPRLWKNEEEIDTTFRVAKEQAFKIFNVLSIVATLDNVEVVPDVDLKGYGDEYEDEFGIYHSHKFAHILTEIQKENIKKQVRRQINITVLDAKRSMIKTTTHIPLWVYAIIVVLGWNEFMIVIRNPLFVTLSILILVSFYFINKFDLWGPVASVAQTAVGETIDTVKLKLRDFVLDEHEKQPKRNSSPDEIFDEKN